MKNITILSLVAISTMTLTACSGFAKGDEFRGTQSAMPASKAKIMVYRNYRLGDKCQPFTVSVDNRSIGTLKCSGYLSTTVAPGRHAIDVSGVIHEHLFTKSEPTHFKSTVNAAGGRTNYYQLSGMGINPATALGTIALATTGFGFSVVQYTVVPVDEKKALSQLQGLYKSA